MITFAIVVLLLGAAAALRRRRRRRQAIDASIVRLSDYVTPLFP